MTGTSFEARAEPNSLFLGRHLDSETRIPPSSSAETVYGLRQRDSEHEFPRNFAIYLRDAALMKSSCSAGDDCRCFPFYRPPLVAIYPFDPL